MRKLSVAVSGLLLLAGSAFADSKAASVTSAFQKAHPKVQLYRDSGRLTRVFGPGISPGGSARTAADNFVTKDSMLFGVRADDLNYIDEIDVMDGKFNYVRYSQSYKGVPVFNGRLVLLYRTEQPNQGIVSVAANLFGISNVAIKKAVVTRDQAVAKWRYWYQDFIIGTPELVVYVPGEGEPVYGWKFTVYNGNLVHPEKYLLIADATKPGAPLVYQENMICTTDVNGTASGWASPGTKPDQANNPETLQPFDDLRVRITGGNTGQTDVTGAFNVVNAGVTPVTISVGLGSSGATQAGQWSTIVDQSGTAVLTQSFAGVTPPGPVTFELNTGKAEYTTAMVNAFMYVTRVHNFVKAITPAYPGVDLQFTTNVNLNDTCNAYYDGSSVNFFRAGGGCPNTAYSTVVAHEYGHHIVAAGGSGQGAYGEGMGDVTGALLMDSACLGEDFLGQGTGCLRSAYNSVSYPVDALEIHEGGKCIAGAFWLTRDALAATNPGSYLSIIRPLFLNSILAHSGSSITPAITVDVLALDDNNGDPNDGTPHYNEIATGFGAKNLDAPIYLFFSYPDGKPETINPAGGTTLRVQVSGVGGFAPQPNTIKLYYSTGGAYTPINMTLVSGNLYEAAFPATPCGTVVKYYVSAQSVSYGTVTDPSDAPSSFNLTISAASLSTIFNDNCESNPGWTVTNSGLTDGPWGRGTPVGGGLRGDPPTDYDGSGQCWLTDNVAGNSDVDGGYTWLISPTFDLAGSNAVISYARWYSNNFGDSPHADTFKVYVSNNNGTSWTLVETVGPAGVQADGGWYTNAFIVSNYVTPTDQVKIRFEASDLGSGSVVEAGVDAIKVQEIECTVPTSLSGSVDLQLLTPSPAGQAVTVELRVPNTLTVVASYPVTLDGSGNYSIPSVPAGTYDVTAQGANWLRSMLQDQVLSGASVASFSLTNGDADGNNANDIFDVNDILVNFLSSGEGDVNWDGVIDVFDLNIAFTYFGLNGD